MMMEDDGPAYLPVQLVKGRLAGNTAAAENSDASWIEFRHKFISIFIAIFQSTLSIHIR